MMKISSKSCPPSLKLQSHILFWGSVLGLFLVVHCTQDYLESMLKALASFSGLGSIETNKQGILSYAASLKGLLFLLSLAILSSPIVRDIHNHLATLTHRRIVYTSILALAAIFVLAMLVFHPSNASMGEIYARQSPSPFQQDSGWYNKRLLMPAVAHMLFFRGEWLYFAFGFMITAGFLILLQNWLKLHSPLPFWKYLSLCTCSFIIFQFQFPGYPDIFAFSLLILVMSPGFNQDSKIALLILALLTHEGSLFISLILAWRYLDRSHFVSYLRVLFLYGFIWLMGFGFKSENLLGSHNVGERSGLEWIRQHPKKEILGVFIAFKAVWLLPIVAFSIDIKQHHWKDAIFIGLCICAGIFMTFLGIDTSRMVGFAFPAILVSLQTIYSYLTPRRRDRLFSVVFLVNFLIPSLYVGLNMPIVVRSGVYMYLYRLITFMKHLVKLSF